ncbi:hypothetical protein [Nocardioides jiangxiensis]|uniref:Uncharacterized protein n=1 Tax=Nocardioides jiangxiensis TaxID=3064524 RepID=A0ABT9B1A5_9ACTN|nr:hypothetical protein [Nocardioides sp. WY-20]MDO7868185.1 hypothetical protein [Nocardioides sp. WY-20]
MTTADAPVVRPLLLIGLGLVINILSPRVDGWDVLPDWCGWVLILIGTWAFARQLPSGRLMIAAAALALVVSAAQWPPAWQVVDPGAIGSRDVSTSDASLLWALSLPALAWMILYCLALAGVSRADAGTSFWWKYLAAANAGAAVLPVFVYGAGMKGLEGLLGVLILLGLIGATVFSFLHSGREWAVVRKA